MRSEPVETGIIASVWILTALWLSLSLWASECRVYVTEVTKTYPRDPYEYRQAGTWDAEEIAQNISADNPHLASHPLSQLLQFAFENAAGHGDSGHGSTVKYSVREAPDGYIRISIRNALLTQLPESLQGKVFTPESLPATVSEAERDKERGIRGKGLPEMFGSLGKIVAKDWPVTGLPTMQWNQIGKEVEFELKLPKSTRVLRERKRR